MDHAVDLNVRRYGENWIKKHGPQTRNGLLNGFKETFSPDLAQKAVDDLFRYEYLLADDDGMIHWAETYEGRKTNEESSPP